MSTTRPHIGIPIGSDRRGKAGEYLQRVLVDLIALSLNGKQAHWHVVGPEFKPVHEQLDEIVNIARDAADIVAERSIQLGVPIDGRPASVEKMTAVEPFPEGFTSARETVALFRDRVTAAVERGRDGLDELGEIDPVTQDLAIEALEGLEKQLWMLQAQLA